MTQDLDIEKAHTEITLRNLRHFRDYLRTVLAEEFDRGVEAAIEKAERDIAKAEERLATF